MYKPQKKLAVPSKSLTLRELTQQELGKVEGGTGYVNRPGTDGTGRNSGGP